MKFLRIGHERFAVLKVTNTKATCIEGHKLNKVKTIVGTFLQCPVCKSTQKVSE